MLLKTERDKDANVTVGDINTECLCGDYGDVGHCVSFFTHSLMKKSFKEVIGCLINLSDYVTSYEDVGVVNIFKTYKFINSLVECLSFNDNEYLCKCALILLTNLCKRDVCFFNYILDTNILEYLSKDIEVQIANCHLIIYFLCFVSEKIPSIITRILKIIDCDDVFSFILIMDQSISINKECIYSKKNINELIDSLFIYIKILSYNSQNYEYIYSIYSKLYDFCNHINYSYIISTVIINICILLSIGKIYDITVLLLKSNNFKSYFLSILKNVDVKDKIRIIYVLCEIALENDVVPFILEYLNENNINLKGIVLSFLNSILKISQLISIDKNFIELLNEIISNSVYTLKSISIEMSINIIIDYKDEDVISLFANEDYLSALINYDVSGKYAKIFDILFEIMKRRNKDVEEVMSNINFHEYMLRVEMNPDSDAQNNLLLMM